ncbi:MAG: hypothetical protein ABIH72_03705 [archaeon]
MPLRGKNTWCLGIVLILILPFISAIRINEVDLNPNDNCNDCTEWVELYSEANIDLQGWKLVDKDNNTMELEGSFSGYLVIEPSISLNNNNEQLFLYNGTELVSQTNVISDSYNDNRSWQYCNGNWMLDISTRGTENLCNQQQNNETQEDGNLTEEIYLEIIIDDKFYQDEEIDLEVKFYNLQDKDYDIKIYLDDEEDTISEIYDESSDNWKSSYYYLENTIKGNEDKLKDFILRLDEDHQDFEGDVKLVVKLRDGKTWENSTEIKIKARKTSENKTVLTSQDEQEEEFEEEVIHLNSANTTKDIKTDYYYKSRNWNIKEYSIYGFALFCVLFIIFLLIKKR